MQYEKQKAACEEYAQKGNGVVADVLRVSGRKGAVVLSKDGRTIYDPFVMEPIKEVITAEPMKEMKNAVKDRVDEDVTLEAKPVVPKKKAPARKKK